MRAVPLDVQPDDELLASRRARGLDRWDEMWEGVLHMVPPPSFDHQRLGAELLVVLHGVASPLGLAVTHETGVFDSDDPDQSYRVPDLSVTRPEHRKQRGIEGGAVLLVEIRSPSDESYEKLPFYAAHGVERVLILEPDTFEADVFVLGAEGYERLEADEQGEKALGVGGLAVGVEVDGDDPEQIGLRVRDGAHVTVLWARDLYAGR